MILETTCAGVYPDILKAEVISGSSTCRMSSMLWAVLEKIGWIPLVRNAVGRCTEECMRAGHKYTEQPNSESRCRKPQARSWLPWKMRKTVAVSQSNPG